MSDRPRPALWRRLLRDIVEQLPRSPDDPDQAEAERDVTTSERRLRLKLHLLQKRGRGGSR